MWVGCIKNWKLYLARIYLVLFLELVSIALLDIAQFLSVSDFASFANILQHFIWLRQMGILKLLTILSQMEWWVSHFCQDITYTFLSIWLQFTEFWVFSFQRVLFGLTCSTYFITHLGIIFLLSFLAGDFMSINCINIFRSVEKL